MQLLSVCFNLQVLKVVFQASKTPLGEWLQIKKPDKPVGDRDHEVLRMGSFGKYNVILSWFGFEESAADPLSVFSDMFTNTTKNNAILINFRALSPLYLLTIV
jgi:hypothetical protein